MLGVVDIFFLRRSVLFGVGSGGGAGAPQKIIC